ncbi:MAG TPA: hypothetical protein QGF58_10850 [Myxococcota bacterium]|nr:hypothetical protein [Myxococcota bacterium]
MSLLVFLACQPDPASWTTLADCEGLDGASQDECFLKIGVETAKTDQAAGVAIIEGIGDPLVKDYGWHSLTRDVDPTTYQWCERIENEKLAERCRVIVSRPHMHQHLVDRAEPGAVGGEKGRKAGREGPPPN